MGLNLPIMSLGLPGEKPTSCGPVTVASTKGLTSTWHLKGGRANALAGTTRHEILVTSWARPKLTPSISRTARGDRARSRQTVSQTEEAG